MRHFWNKSLSVSLSLSPSSLPLSPYPHLSLSSLIPQNLNEDILKIHSNIKEGAHRFFGKSLQNMKCLGR